MVQSKRRRVQAPLETSCEDDSNCDPPEWRMELTRDGGAGESISTDVKDTCDNKEKCSPDGSGKGNGKSGTIQ